MHFAEPLTATQESSLGSSQEILSKERHHGLESVCKIITEAVSEHKRQEKVIELKLSLEDRKNNLKSVNQILQTTSSRFQNHKKAFDASEFESYELGIKLVSLTRNLFGMKAEVGMANRRPLTRSRGSGTLSSNSGGFIPESHRQRNTKVQMQIDHMNNTIREQENVTKQRDILSGKLAECRGRIESLQIQASGIEETIENLESEIRDLTKDMPEQCAQDYTELDERLLGPNMLGTPEFLNLLEAL